MDIKDKVVIVTGASQGIGRATSRLLAKNGAKVVLAARSKELLEKLVSELPNALSVPTDMTNTEDVEHLIAVAKDRYGRVDILVNNAGRGLWVSLEKTDLKQYQDLIDLNVLGYVRAMQAVVPVMREAGGGLVVNVSSMVTKHPFPNLAAYTSTKQAVNALTEVSRMELEKDGISVALIRPKLVETDFGKHADMEEPEALRDRNNPQSPPMDTPEFVAEKILELIQSEAIEMDL